jgi:hypothetical protein
MKSTELQRWVIDCDDWEKPSVSVGRIVRLLGARIESTV